MTEKKLVILGIGLILIFLGMYLGSKSPLDLFNITIGTMILISGFYVEGKKIKVSLSYAVAMFGVNIVQWFILTYTYFYYPFYDGNEYLIPLIGAPLFTLYIANQVRKEYLKSSETKVNILKDKTKLTLLFMSMIIIIGSLAGFIAYYNPIFLYGITLGLMTFVYGYYHENKKVNVSIRYAVAMGFLLILQFFILIYFAYQIGDDWPFAFASSMMITIYFLIQISRSDLKVSNEKKEKIIGLSAIMIFIVIMALLILR